MSDSKIGIFENLCRTCMGEQQTETVPTSTIQKAKVLIPIYQEYEVKNYGNINIIEILEQASPQLTVEADDMLPKNICESCLDMLVDIHKFQKKSLRVEQRLRDIIKQYYNPLQEVDVDLLNTSSIQDGDGENIKIEIEEPANTPIYLCSEEFDTEDNVDGKWNPQSSQARNNDNDNLLEVMSWKYIERDYQDAIPAKKEQNSDREGFVNGEVDSSIHRHEQDERRLDTKSRVLRNPNREFEKAVDEEVDNERKHDATKAIGNNMKEIAEEESLESEVSDYNETSGRDDSEWEPPVDKLETFKCKSIKNDTKLEGNQQEKLDLKNEDKPVVHVKLDTRGFSCNVCGERLKTRIGLKMHLKIHPKNKQNQHIAQNGHICPECGVRLKSRATYRRHILLHEKDETKIKYKCQYCNKVFNQSGALRYHAQMHTGERPYLCSICGESFATQCSLKQHGRHGTEFNYQCPKCPKRFRTSSSMSAHKAIVHIKLRPHVCDVCGASFEKLYSLRRHKKIHGEKKHKCDHCEMKFAQLDQRRRHMRTHTGEKPYKCRYCGRAYAQSNDMIKHLRVHLGDNVYRCEMCPQAFRLLCELRVHFASHKDDDEHTKLQNLQALKKEEDRIQAKMERSKVSVKQSE